MGFVRKNFYVSPSKLTAINFAVLTAIGIMFLRTELNLNDYILIEGGGALTAIFLAALISTRRIKQSRMKPEAVDRVVLDGPYSIVRHPYYTGIICMNIACIFFFRTPWLIPAVIVFSVLWYHEARYEEQALIDKFEVVYLSYIESKGMFFPRLRKPGA